ncbi:MAG: hypothetical protein AVDCRST_MAG27-2382, partial [uncultured Craurococcus sp.]
WQHLPGRCGGGCAPQGPRALIRRKPKLFRSGSAMAMCRPTPSNGRIDKN